MVPPSHHKRELLTTRSKISFRHSSDRTKFLRRRSVSLSFFVLENRGQFTSDAGTPIVFQCCFVPKAFQQRLYRSPATPIDRRHSHGQSSRLRNLPHNSRQGFQQESRQTHLSPPGTQDHPAKPLERRATPQPRRYPLRMRLFPPRKFHRSH